MKILLVNSPRKFWPYINEEDNFVLPQWMPAIGAIARQAGHQVQCLDCMVSKVGWTSLRQIIKDEKPDLIGINESHTLYIHEAIRLITLIKEISPHTKIVGGGVHMTNCAPEILRDNPIDFIVKGEGELPFRALLNELEKIRPDFSSVDGLAWKNDSGEVVINRPGHLVANMDELPFPAYDLLPVKAYGKSRYLFSPGGMTIHHSRGCISDCEFCVWWTIMAKRQLNAQGEEILSPTWRTKSVERVIEEIKIIKKDYDKHCFLFTDDSWNISPGWNDRFAETVLKENIRMNWFAFMRADFMLRDEKKGILEKLVRSGLSHFCMGVEHASQDVLDGFNKSFYSPGDSELVLDIFKKKYPGVFIQTTFIVGNQQESRESIRGLLKYVKKLKVDFPSFHILTPFPGTALYKKFKEQGIEMESDYSKYDLNTPIVSTDNLTRDEVAWEVYLLFRKSVTLAWLFRGLFSRSGYKRRMYIWWLKVTWKLFIGMIKERVFNMRSGIDLVVPDWYEK